MKARVAISRRSREPGKVSAMPRRPRPAVPRRQAPDAHVRRALPPLPISRSAARRRAELARTGDLLDSSSLPLLPLRPPLFPLPLANPSRQHRLILWRASCGAGLQPAAVFRRLRGVRRLLKQARRLKPDPTFSEPLVGRPILAAADFKVGSGEAITRRAASCATIDLKWKLSVDAPF